MPKKKKSKKTKPSYYATVRWAPEDIKSLKPDWSLADCEEFLQENEGHIQDRLVELGWEVIDSLL